MDQSCPVCENGVVPAAFYGGDGDEMVTCRTCGGSQSIPRPSAQPEEAAAGSGDPRQISGL